MEHIEKQLKQISNNAKLTSHWQNEELQNLMDFTKHTPPVHPVVAHIYMIRQYFPIYHIAFALVVAGLGASLLLYLQIVSQRSTKPYSIQQNNTSTPAPTSTFYHSSETMVFPTHSPTGASILNLTPVPSPIPKNTDKSENSRDKSNRGLHLGWDESNK